VTPEKPSETAPMPLTLRLVPRPRVKYNIHRVVVFRFCFFFLFVIYSRELCASKRQYPHTVLHTLHSTPLQKRYCVSVIVFFSRYFISSKYINRKDIKIQAERRGFYLWNYTQRTGLLRFKRVILPTRRRVQPQTICWFFVHLIQTVVRYIAVGKNVDRAHVFSGRKQSINARV